MSKIYEALNYSSPDYVIPAFKNILKFFHPHTYCLPLPSLLGFCFWDTHKCFRERVTIFLKKPRKSARESLLLVLFNLEFQLSTGVLNAAMWNIFVATLL